MGAITPQNVAQAIVKLIASEVMEPLQGTMIMGNLVTRDFSPDIQSAGASLSIPLPPVMTANNIAVGGSVQTQNPALGSVSLTLDTHAESTFQIPDVSKALANIDLLRTYLKPAVIAVAEKVEADLLGLYTRVSQTVGAGNTALTEDTIDDAETALFTAKVPQSEQKHLVVSADAYGTLRRIKRFTEDSVSAGSGSAIATGHVGRIKGFDVYRHTQVPKVSTTTYNLAFSRQGIMLAMRRLPQPLPGTGAIAEYVEHNGFGMRVVMSYAPNTLAQQFTVDMLYGVATARPQFTMQVLS